MNTTKKNLLIVFLLLIFFIYFSIRSYVSAVSSDISNSVLRLHVIANSDSEEDQNLKYKVRDSIINYMNNYAINSKSKEEAIIFVNEHLNDIKQIAEETVRDNGYNYLINVSIGNFNFPTKTYGDLSFPAGYYDALKVEIGNSNGQNWWCVMFPPLCFVDITSAEVPDSSKENIRENLSDEEYSIISKNDNTSEFKFKIVEIFNNLKIVQ